MARPSSKGQKALDCTLDPSAQHRNFCSPDMCRWCGWGRVERERRERYLKRYGLTKCEDGLYRLVIDEEKMTSMLAEEKLSRG